MNNFQKWQNQDNSNKHRILALVIGALIFPITIPTFLIVVLPHIDNYFGISSFFYGLGNIIIGVIAIIIGWHRRNMDNSNSNHFSIGNTFSNASH